jgi:hypothetical protein
MYATVGERGLATLVRVLLPDRPCPDAMVRAVERSQRNAGLREGRVAARMAVFISIICQA